uniref:Uncharacterized protein n=1 Tax=Arundo donax TaxID=35708 RepID=A0A0A8ZPC7_ARUDO
MDPTIDQVIARARN